MVRSINYSRCGKEPISLVDFLKVRFPYATEAEWTVRIGEGRFTINGETATLKSQPLPKRARIVYDAPERPEPLVNKNFRIVYSDDHIVVFDKPANLPVSPGGAYEQNTLAYLGAQYLEQLKKDSERIMVEKVPIVKPLFAVHRLDKHTSGLVVMAQTKAAAHELSRSFSHQSTTEEGSEVPVTKVYTALVHGILETEQRVCLAIGHEAKMLKSSSRVDKMRMAPFATISEDTPQSYIGIQSMPTDPNNPHKPRTACTLITPIRFFKISSQRFESPDSHSESVSGSLTVSPKPLDIVKRPIKLCENCRNRRLSTFPSQLDPSLTKEQSQTSGTELASIPIYLKDDFRGFTLVRCRLFTGRTHQIRVHCSALGHGIVGDSLYSSQLGGSVSEDTFISPNRNFVQLRIPVPRRTGDVCIRDLLIQYTSSIPNPFIGLVCDSPCIHCHPASQTSDGRPVLYEDDSVFKQQQQLRLQQSVLFTEQIASLDSTEFTLVPVSRHLLHASELSFTHPITRKRLHFTSDALLAFTRDAPELIDRLKS